MDYPLYGRSRRRPDLGGGAVRDATIRREDSIPVRPGVPATPHRGEPC